jgi:lysophospholipase L1-like esterase
VKRAAALLVAFGVAVPLATLPARPPAAPAYQSAPPRRTVVERDWGPWLGPFRAALVPGLMQDFGERYLYAEADRRLPPPRPGERRVVFLGDSITDRWDLTRSFPGRPYVNRGIGSQVTAQMILRFHQDVIALKPSAVMILAGINDVQGFLQRETVEQIEANYETMADLAQAHGIRVIFGSVLPVHDYTQAAHDVLKDHDITKIRALNAWLKDFCLARRFAYADYSALADARGLLKSDLSDDGIHPLARGYDLMAPIARQAIDRSFSAEVDPPSSVRPE